MEMCLYPPQLFAHIKKLRMRLCVLDNDLPHLSKLIS